MDLERTLEEARMGALDWHKLKPGEVLVLMRSCDGPGIFRAIVLRSFELLTAKVKEITAESMINSSDISRLLIATRMPRPDVAERLMRALRRRLLLVYKED